MTLYVKDANSTTQPISTQPDTAGNLVPMHVPATLVAGIATPVSTAAPLPVEVAAGTPAVVGDATIVSNTQAQTLFSGVTPVNGFSICNNCASAMWVSDGGTAANNVGFYIAASGGIYTTPPGYKPAGPVSLFGGTTSGNFAARRW